MKWSFMFVVLLLVCGNTHAAGRSNRLTSLFLQDKVERLASLFVGKHGSLNGGKFSQKLFAMAGVAILFCSSIACDMSRRVLLDSLEAREAERNGQQIQLVVDGVSYEGLARITFDDRLQVEITEDDGIPLEQIEGYRIPDHQDIGATVYLHGTRNDVIYRRYGDVEEVYDSGYYKIEVHTEGYLWQDTGIAVAARYLNEPEYVITHKFASLENGGFIFE